MANAKRNVWVGAGITENYYPKASHFKYFEGLDKLAGTGVKLFTMLVDYSDDAAEQMEFLYSNISFIRLPHSEVVMPSPIRCVQHGAFLERLLATENLSDDDYVLFTDSDMTIQRPFTEDELEIFQQGKVFVAMNWHDHETLSEELTALQIRQPIEKLDELFPNFRKMWCYNTGVFGATVADWKRIRARYIELFPKIDPILGHYAKQQWVISWFLQNDGYDLVDPLSEVVRNIHCHGHHGAALIDNRVVLLPAGEIGRLGKSIVFAHNIRR